MRKARKFAEHGGTARVIAVLWAVVMVPILQALVAVAAFLYLPVALMAADRLQQSAVCSMAGGSPSANIGNLIARVTRDQSAEYEQTLQFTALGQATTPTSLRTDRKVKYITLHFRGRITNAATGPTLRTAPPLLGTQLFGLIQQVTIRGQHLRYGSQTIVQMRGEAIAEYMALMYPNYAPTFTVAQNGGAPVRSGALDVTLAHTNDVDFTLPIPLYPPNINAADIPFYTLHGPDWPGNLYMDVLFADGTALATANPPVLFAGYGGVGANPTVDILTERPLLGKDLMAQIKPAVTFRQQNFGQPTATVSGVSGSGVKLADLFVGKDTARIFVKVGTQGAGQSAGVTAYGALSDSIITRTFFQLDNRQLRFQGPNGDGAAIDYVGRNMSRVIPIGYRLIDFISVPGQSDANPKAAFPSSKLTAARQFQLNGDVTSGANQICEEVQEMILGSPAYNG